MVKNNEWKKLNLSDCVDIYQGGTPSTTNPSYWGGEIVWVTPTDITSLSGRIILSSERKITEEGLEKSSAVLLQPGTILLCSRATIGASAIAGVPLATNQGFKNLVAKENCDSTFLYYLLKTKVGEMLSKASGSTFLEISKTNLLNISISIPPIEEQKRIAKTLVTLDDFLKDLDNQIEKKQGVRDGMLEDLVSGKARLPGFNGDWEIAELHEIADMYDGTHQTPKYTNSGIRFISVEDISNIYGSQKYISNEDFIRDFKVFPEIGDIVMTRIGDIGTPALITNDEPLSYYVSLALLKNIKLVPSFLKFYIIGKEFKRELDKRTLHQAYPKKINKNEIGYCLVKYPPESEQRAISEILISMEDELELLKQKKAKYTMIRNGIMEELLIKPSRLKKQEVQ